jgi:hypothetical protein
MRLLSPLWRLIVSLRWSLPILAGLLVWLGITTWLRWLPVTRYIFPLSSHTDISFCGPGLLLQDPPSYVDLEKLHETLIPPEARSLRFPVPANPVTQTGELLFPVLLQNNNPTLKFWNVTQNTVKTWKSWSKTSRVMLSADAGTLVTMTPFPPNLLFGLGSHPLVHLCGAGFHDAPIFQAAPPSDDWGLLLMHVWNLPDGTLRSSISLPPLTRIGEVFQLSPDGLWLLAGPHVSRSIFSATLFNPHLILFWSTLHSPDTPPLRAICTADGTVHEIRVLQDIPWSASFLAGHIVSLRQEFPNQPEHDLINPANKRTVPIDDIRGNPLWCQMQGENWRYWIRGGSHLANSFIAGTVTPTDHQYHNTLLADPNSFFFERLIPGKSQTLINYSTTDRTPAWLNKWLTRLGLEQYSPWRPIKYFGIFDWESQRWLAQWTSPLNLVTCQVNADGTKCLVGWRDPVYPAKLYCDILNLNLLTISPWWARIAGLLTALLLLLVLLRKSLFLNLPHPSPGQP